MHFRPHRGGETSNVGPRGAAGAAEPVSVPFPIARLRSHLTYANVVSTLCLFILLGGVAYAGTQLGKNSVGTKQLKKAAVTEAKIAAGAVNGEKVADGSLTGADVSAATLGKVPSAANADHASTAGTATSAASAGTAVSAANAAKAEVAADAEKLGGSAPSAFGAVLTSMAPLANVNTDIFVPVSGIGSSSTEVPTKMTLPNQKLVATNIVARVTGPASATEFISVYLRIDGVATLVCTLEEIPDLCTPSMAIPLEPASQLSWFLSSGLGSAEFQPELALRLIRG